MKLGELRRGEEAVEEEGANACAHWCPQKRVLAVATQRSHLQLYALNVSSEALWRLPDGQDVRRVNLYLSHRRARLPCAAALLLPRCSCRCPPCRRPPCRCPPCRCPPCRCVPACAQAPVASLAGWPTRVCTTVHPYRCRSIHLDYGPVRIAGLGGDARSLLVALTNGTMQVFSWQGKVRWGERPRGGDAQLIWEGSSCVWPCGSCHPCVGVHPNRAGVRSTAHVHPPALCRCCSCAARPTRL